MLTEGYYFSLEGFDWNGKDYELNQSACVFYHNNLIHEIQNKFSEHKFEAVWGSERYSRLCAIKYWLLVKSPTSEEEAENTAALFLWSLWLAARTRVRIWAQIELFQTRMGDQLQSRWWTTTYELNRISPVDRITDQVLDAVKKNLSTALKIYTRRDELPRLSEALFLSHLGCKNMNWQAAFILWMASLETLLLEPKPENEGFAKTVCSRVARLLSASRADYDRYYKQIDYLYNIRSDIVHGKFGARAWDTGNPEDRLKQLAQLETVLKSVWHKVLALKDIEGTLEKRSDRDLFFNHILPRF